MSRHNEFTFFRIKTRYVFEILVNFFFNFMFENKNIDCKFFRDDVFIDNNDIITIHHFKIVNIFYAIDFWMLTSKVVSFVVVFQLNAQIKKELKFSMKFFRLTSKASTTKIISIFDINVSIIIFVLMSFEFSNTLRWISSNHRRFWKKFVTFASKFLSSKNLITILSSRVVSRTTLIHNDIKKSLELNVNEKVRFNFIFMCDWSKRLKIYIIIQRFQIFICFKIYKKSIEHDDYCIHRFRIDYKNEYENY